MQRLVDPALKLKLRMAAGHDGAEGRDYPNLKHAAVHERAEIWSTQASAVLQVMIQLGN